MTALLGASRRRTLLALVLVLAGAGVLGYLQLRAEPETDPYAPESYQPDGTRALVDTLEGLGADVIVERQVPAGVDSAVVFRDDLDDGERRAVETAAEAGATVLVADAMSPLAAEVNQASLGAVDALRVDPTPSCPVSAVANLGTVRAHGVAFAPDEGEVGCYPIDGGPWLVVTPTGDGHVVSVGSPGWLTNAEITRVDHAPLATALLLPSDGAEVAVVPPGEFVPTGDGQGFPAAFAYVPDAVWALLAQLGVAVLVFMAWRARRLGRPVTEDQPVALPGSELVVAVGELLQATGSAAYAGERLRDDVTADLGRRLGLSAEADRDEVARAAAEAGADEAQAERSLTGAPAADDRALADLARDLEEVRAAVDRGVRVRA